MCVAVFRAGSAQPVAYDTPYDDDGQSASEGHHEWHQQGGEAGGVQHKGPGGLMVHMYNRKFEQAQQVGLQCILFWGKRMRYSSVQHIFVQKLHVM